MNKRYQAYKLLKEIIFEKRHAHLVLKESDANKEDQKFITALVYTVLQNYLLLTYQLDRYIDKKIDKEVWLLLMMAGAELLKMDGTPDYAVGNYYVDLTKKIKKSRLSGVVNAVIKKISQNGMMPIEGDTIKIASITYSIPEWILRLLKSQYSEAFAIDYAKYTSGIKPNYVRFNTLKNCPYDEELFEKIDGNIVSKSTLFQSDYLEKGCVVIQDINSQKVVPYLELKENMSVLDVCCGPGTKTLHIANELNNTGKIIGVELHQSRSDKTIELLQRCDVTNTEVITQDALDFTSNELFDRILVDAPCSGLGVLTGKPDLRYNILPEHLDELETLQAQILQHVSQFLKVEGILVYATCTLNKKENERQIQKFLLNNENYTLIEDETLVPMNTNGDGFYMAKLKRIA